MSCRALYVSLVYYTIRPDDRSGGARDLALFLHRVVAFYAKDIQRL